MGRIQELIDVVRASHAGIKWRRGAEDVLCCLDLTTCHLTGILWVMFCCHCCYDYPTDMMAKRAKAADARFRATLAGLIHDFNAASCGLGWAMHISTTRATLYITEESIVEEWLQSR